MTFQVAQDGYITGLRFYKGAGNTGTHVGHLWDAAGNLLATVTFSGETATGWQQATFATPVAVVAGQTYTASYYAPAGHYAASTSYFGPSGTTNGPLTAMMGVYRYGVNGGFPTTTYRATNYWVDVLFSSELPAPPAAPQAPAVQATSITRLSAAEVTTLAGSAAPASDTVAPTIVGRSTQPGETGVAPRSNVSVTFSESVRPGTISLRVLDQDNHELSGTLRYDEASKTASFLPQSTTGRPQGCCGQCSHCPLRPATTYRVTVAGAQDLAGNTMAAASWSFTTSDLVAGATLWNDGPLPTTAVSVVDATPTEVGMTFQVAQDGYITGLRFYKGADNTGVHVGHLWDQSGIPLAIATFTDETDSGWQQVNFHAPVPVNANTNYIASYYAPVGGYSVSEKFFGSAGVSGAMVRVPAGGGGVYFHGTGGAFPANKSSGANYWVDVVYSNVPLTVVAHSPDSAGKGAGALTSISAAFSAQVQTDSLSFVVRDASGREVSGSVRYDRTRNRAVFTPSSALVASGRYTATVGATDEWGNTMTPFTWTFSASDVSSAGAGDAGGTTVGHTRQTAARQLVPPRRSLLGDSAGGTLAR
jgi:hypothetical protein